MKEHNLVEEEIYGFNVTVQRKKVWKIELDMVKEFVSICSKNGLTYFASGGTLLGDIRHNGFIPWDDDVDLMMPRKDYEKFLQIAPGLLPKNYFLQHNGSEKFYLNGHAQIRNNDTTCFVKGGYDDLKRGKNCGIFIDVFPYDNVPDNFKLRKKFSFRVLKLKKLIARVTHKTDSRLKQLIKRCVYAFYYSDESIEKLIRNLNSLSQKYNSKTNTVALLSFMPGYEKNVWEEKLFKNITLHDFEDIKIAIPVAYDDVLRKEFGEYMQIPKDLENGSMHGKCFFDTTKSYKEYFDISKDEYNNLIKSFEL